MTPEDIRKLPTYESALAEIDRLREELKASHENNRALLLSSVPKEELLGCQRELKEQNQRMNADRDKEAAAYSERITHLENLRTEHLKVIHALEFQLQAGGNNG